MKKFLITLFVLSAPNANADEPIDYTQPINSVYWSDGDSGRISFESGLKIKFRLNSLDAPETGGVGAAIGGAKCEKERELGFKTKEFIVEFTRGKEIQIINHYGKTDTVGMLLIYQ